MIFMCTYASDVALGVNIVQNVSVTGWPPTVKAIAAPLKIASVVFNRITKPPNKHILNQ